MNIVKRLLILFRVVGPGIIVMVADNDVGGIMTYLDAGHTYKYKLFYVLLFLLPVLYLSQEMALRLGIVTKQGHAYLIRKRFGKFWGSFSLIDLLVVNFLTIVTEFIGIVIVSQLFHISKYILIGFTLLIIWLLTVRHSLRTWEIGMYILIGFNILILPIAIHSGIFYNINSIHYILHPDFTILHKQTAMVFVVSLIGTTVAPWQLFFQQSNTIDKKIPLKQINYARLETFLSTIISIIIASFFMNIGAFVKIPKDKEGFAELYYVVRYLDTQLGHIYGIIFGLLIVSSAIIGIIVVTLANSYAISEFFNKKHSLNHSIKDEPTFYSAFWGFIILSSILVTIPNLPFDLIVQSIQMLAGILLPAATIFLLILCNDKALLGPWVNKFITNIATFIIIGVLIIFSFTLTVLSVFTLSSHALFNVISVMFIVMLLSVLVFILYYLYTNKGKDKNGNISRYKWATPDIEALESIEFTTIHKIFILILRIYLLVAIFIIFIKLFLY